jgi:hypothetical protein
MREVPRPRLQVPILSDFHPLASRLSVCCLLRTKDCEHVQQFAGKIHITDSAADMHMFVRYISTCIVVQASSPAAQIYTQRGPVFLWRRALAPVLPARFQKSVSDSDRD